MQASTDSFNRNLLLGFGASLLLLIISAVASFISIQNLLYSNRMANKAKDANVKLEQALSFLKDAETAQRGYLLTANPLFLEPYKGKRDSVMMMLREVKELTQENEQQQKNIDRLANLVNQRWVALATLIDEKQNGKALAPESLLRGKMWMDEARTLVDTMQQNELALLAQRTERFDRFSSFTPVLIVITTLIAIISTLLFFNRVRNDFAQKNRLQRELQEKDAALARRIGITRKVAAEIANGSYSVRVDEQEGDELGSLATDLNRMAKSLEDTFNQLHEKEWFLAGQALVNEIMLGQKSMEVMTLELLRGVADYVKAEMGALYLLSETGTVLSRVATIGLKPDAGATTLAVGAGLAGRCAAEAATLHLKAEEQEQRPYLFETVAGTLRPAGFVAVPLMYQGRVNGVLELATLSSLEAGAQDLLEDAGRAIGIAVNTLQNNIRLQELLQQTQAQSEELQAQHTELENINTELEAQTNKLLASEEELRVQQEELMEANAVLEERTRMLEERNEEVAQRNKEVQRQADELARTTRYKSEFLANMSHELRTPLNSILLLSRLLEENKDGSLSQEQTEYARVIQSSGKGLLALIDEVLDLSKIEAGKMELEMHTVAVDELLKDMQDLFAPLAKEKNLSFQIAVEDAPATIRTDQQRLEQILKNLLSNAIKFTKEGSVTMTIDSNEENIRFAVRDTGIGISPAHMEGIFEAFRQADGTTRRRFGGTGLGLSISKELARLLGGDITATSETGKGSTFVLVVPKALEISAAAEPAQASPLPEIPQQPMPAPVPQQPAEAIPAASQPPRSLLIIEDDAPFAAALKDFIKERGYDVLVAPDGEAGLSMLQQEKPDGILLDIMLPGKDGWEVLDELKKDPANRGIPVHVMSSLNARRESLERGASGFISKPLAFEQMSDVIKNLEEMRVREEGGKALIIEDNLRHAKALAGFLAEHRITAAVASEEAEALALLQNNTYDCVILETFTHKMELAQVIQRARGAGIDKVSILVFTGRHLASGEAQSLKQYADSIVLKTAHSYQRVLDEVSLFIHNLENPARKKQRKRHQSSMDVLRGKRLLIADDDVRNIFSLTKLLEQHGIMVKAATDGREAVDQMLQGEQVDAILMDIMMPEMDGFEAIRRIRKLPGCAELPIIAITAKAMKGDKEKCLQAGASDYISKPVDVDQLLSLLRVWLYERGL